MAEGAEKTVSPSVATAFQPPTCKCPVAVRTVGGRAIGRGRNAAGATRRPPPGDRVFGCAGAGYLTSLKPTFPSGPVAYTRVAIAAFMSSRLSQAPKVHSRSSSIVWSEGSDLDCRTTTIKTRSICCGLSETRLMTLMRWLAIPWRMPRQAMSACLRRTSGLLDSQAVRLPSH